MIRQIYQSNKKTFRLLQSGLIKAILDLKENDILIFEYYNEQNKKITKKIKCVGELK